MTKKMDQVLIIDIECTCWKDDIIPPGQECEIIEIGICVLDLIKNERIEKESILIAPEYSTVSSFCTELTSLTQEQVQRGVTFTEACKILRKRFLSRRLVWASYGNFDRRQFEKQCQKRSILCPFGTTHLNIKALLALILRLPHEIGLEKALKLLDISFEGEHHRGVDDAWNTALILAKLLAKR